MMDYKLTFELGKKISMVVYPIDTFLGFVNNQEKLTFYINNEKANSIIKVDGSYVFSDIKNSDIYEITVLSDRYFKNVLVISKMELIENNKIVYMYLRPNPNYKFPKLSTLVRFSIWDNNFPLTNVMIRAIVISEEANMGNVGKNGVLEGSMEIAIPNLSREISAGDMFLVRGSGEEYFIVKNKINGLKKFLVTKPFKFSYQKGDSIVQIMDTISNENGEGVIFFRVSLLEKFNVRLEIKYRNKISIKEVEVFENTAVNVGHILI